MLILEIPPVFSIRIGNTIWSRVHGHTWKIIQSVDVILCPSAYSNINKVQTINNTLPKELTIFTSMSPGNLSLHKQLSIISPI